MTLVPRRSPSGSFDEMLAGSGDDARGSTCECVVDVTAAVEIRGDELEIEGGKERARRVE